MSVRASRKRSRTDWERVKKMKDQEIAWLCSCDHLCQTPQYVLFCRPVVRQHPDLAVGEAEKCFENAPYIGHIVDATLELVDTLVIVDAYK